MAHHWSMGPVSFVWHGYLWALVWFTEKWTGRIQLPYIRITRRRVICMSMGMREESDHD